MANKQICIIPAKGRSSRFKSKNIELFLGKPLLGHVIKKAIVSKQFDKIIVSTEDEAIAQIAEDFGAKVPFIRPEALSQDPATVIDVVKHAINFFEKNAEKYENVTILLPTCPLLFPSHLVAAHKLYSESGKKGLVSIAKNDVPAFNAYIIENNEIKPCFPNSIYKYTKSTECPVTYRSNGGIIILDIESLMNVHDYRELDLAPYIMEKFNSVDVDYQGDLDFAEYLVRTNKISYSMDIFNE